MGRRAFKGAVSAANVAVILRTISAKYGANRVPQRKATLLAEEIYISRKSFSYRKIFPRGANGCDFKGAVSAANVVVILRTISAKYGAN